MKLCKDCKHVVKGLFWFDPDSWKCKTGMLSRKPSPLTGKLRPSQYPELEHCELKRKYDSDSCGPDGDLWEPKRGGK